MLRDCNTLESNISVQLLNRDEGEMVRSALKYETKCFRFSSRSI